MLTVKTYFCKQAQLSFNYQIDIDGTKTTHAFVMESNNTCTVIDPIKQKAIEDSKYFKSGWLVVKTEKEADAADEYRYNKEKLKEKKIIDLSINNPKKSMKVQETAQMQVVDEKEIDATVELDNAVNAEMASQAVKDNNYDNVTTIQQAKDVLRSEPFNVPFQSLNTPTNILKKAEELGVSFPNL